ncbi:MAG: sugar ABC transporter permease [Clostridiales bacterium]|jgi:multiple sugar transport system permease protein|nr:sugar ABC transporter permease [Clostridiales bacterium]
MQNIKKFARSNAVPYMFLLPWLAGFFVLTLYPMFRSLYLSFTAYDMASPPIWVGPLNYLRMLSSDLSNGDPQYLKSLRVTFTYVFTSVPLKLAFALLVAVLMNRKLRLVSMYRAVYYIPTLLGGSVAIAVLWRKLFAKDGVINGIIAAVTGIGDLPGWISNPKYALGTLIILTVWQFGSSMIIFLAGLKQIPADYYEAASIDGASKAQQFFRITIPALSPVILFNLVMQMISAFQAFTQAYIISNGKGGPIDSTLFYTLHLYNKGFYYYEMGYASAMAWVLLLIIAVMTAVIFRSSGTWVSYGGGE